MTSEDKVLVRINKGFGSHTIMQSVVDEAGEERLEGVLYRFSDPPFELSISDYERRTHKFALCDAETGEILQPEIKASTMAAKVAAAKAKTSKTVA